uniref:Uncharacterized protein n=1 Tax=Arundo donax TaxID=35708 RepID=A0A0A9D657_ARUDO
MQSAYSLGARWKDPSRASNTHTLPITNHIAKNSSRNALALFIRYELFLRASLAPCISGSPERASPRPAAAEECRWRQ